MEEGELVALSVLVVAEEGGGCVIGTVVGVVVVDVGVGVVDVSVRLRLGSGYGERTEWSA